ncbi:TPA: hypothetical protein ACX6PV_003686 [Photobacterium damselae]
MKMVFTLLLLVLGLFWIIPNETNIDDLNELKSIVKEYAVSQDKKFISIHINSVRDIASSNNIEEKIYSMMKVNNIYEINYSNKKNESVLFILDNFFGNNKSYVYSSDNYTEALQVHSVKDFIDKFRRDQNEKYFSVCEKLEQKNWFFCENNH